jgi:glycosyltransferase involved in cell wall biosynthesis
VSVDGRLARELRQQGSEPQVLGAAKFSRPDSIWRARRALKPLLTFSSVDAVIAHAPWSYALAAPPVRRTVHPLLLWVHDAPQPAAFLERRVTVRPPDGCICNSAFIAGRVSAWLPAVPRAIIYPAVAPHAPVSAAERETLRRELGADHATTVILMAARLEPYKGHEVLLAAASRLRGAFMIWLAAGPQRPHEHQYLASLMRMAESLPAGTVRFLGERTDVPRLMAAADVYCQPNTAPEPFGIVFAEALAAGTPVVTPAIGGAVEIAGEGCGILVPDSSPETIASALQRLIDDRDLRVALGAAGPERAARITDAAARVRQIDEFVAATRARRSAA